MVRLKNRHLLVQILYPSTSRDTALKQNAVTAPNQSSSSVFLFHAPTSDAINAPFLTRLIRNQVAVFFGDQGAGALGSSLAVKYFSNATSTFIVRCSRTCVRQVWAALTLTIEIKIPRAGKDSPKSSGTVTKLIKGQDETVPVVMQVLRVSGTIKKAEEEAIERAKAICGRIKGLEDSASSGIKTLGTRRTEIDDFNDRAVDNALLEDHGIDDDEELLTDNDSDDDG